MNLKFIAVSCCLLFLVVRAGAQQSPGSQDEQLQSLRKELATIRVQLDSLRASAPQGLDDQSDAIDRLEEKLDRRLTLLEQKIDAVNRASAPIAFNPRMTAFFNVAARADDHSVLDAKGVSEISNRPFLRTVEVDLRAPVDPYAEAVTIISLENQAGPEFGVDAEEAYGLIKRLPILESAPLGLKIKLGKFRAPLGTDNKIHMHDLPWTTRPLLVSKFMGTDHGDFFESGYNPVGMDLDFYLPNPIPATTLEANVDVVRGGDLGLTMGHSTAHTAYIGHLNLSGDWNNEHVFVIGASGYAENTVNPTTLAGLDLTYKWAPAEERESHSFVAGGEVFVGNRTMNDSLGVARTSSPVGWFAYAQLQTSYWLYLGLRYDDVQEPSNNKLQTRAVAAYASYYTTEFFRLRVGFEHREGSAVPSSTLNSVIMEFNFVFGSHPTEPYWVNR